MAVWSAPSSRPRAGMALSSAWGSSPPAAAAPSPAATRPARPATRIMKNSSRLAEKMARNLSRSSSGTDGSSARASTRALKSSQERSRSSRSPPPLAVSGAASFLAAFFPMPSPYGGDTLHCSAIRFLHDEVLVGRYAQRSPNGFKELSRPELEVGVAGTAELLLTSGERLV